MDHFNACSIYSGQNHRYSYSYSRKKPHYSFCLFLFYKISIIIPGIFAKKSQITLKWFKYCFFLYPSELCLPKKNYRRLGQQKFFRSFRSRQVKEVADRESSYVLLSLFNGNATRLTGIFTANKITRDWSKTSRDFLSNLK